MYIFYLLEPKYQMVSWNVLVKCCPWLIFILHSSRVIGTTIRIGYMWETDGESSAVVIQTIIGELTTNVSDQLPNHNITYDVTSYSLIMDAQIIVSSQYASKDLIIAAPVHCLTLPVLKSAFIRVPAPAIVMTYSACPDDVIPNTRNDLPVMLHDLLLHLSWKSFIVIYDNTYDNVAQYTDDLLHYHMVKLMEVKEGSLMTSSDAVDFLQNLHKHDPSVCRFLVLCSVTCEHNFLVAANEMDGLTEKQGLFNLFSEWIFVANTTSQELLLGHIGDLTNVAFVSPGEEKHSAQDSLRQNSQLLRDQIIKYVSDNSSQLLIGCSTGAPCPNVLQVEDVQSTRQLEIRSAVWAPYNTTGARSRFFSLTARWDGTGHLSLYSVIFPHKNYGFNRKQFTVVTILSPPWVKRNDSAPFGVSGICIDMLYELSDKLNFTYVITEPDDLQFGVERTPGNWSGSIGMLHRKEVDLVVTALPMTPGRQEVVDFTVPFYVDQYTVAYKRIDSITNKYRLFIEPFKWQVWVSILMTLLATSVIVYMVHRLSPYYCKQEANDGLGYWHHSFWFCFGAILQQGAVHQPAACSGRIIVGFWWLCTIVLVAVYTGNLIAFLTVSLEFPPFKTIDGLLAQSSYKFGFRNGTQLEDVIMIHKNGGELYQRIYERIVRMAAKDPDVMSMSHEVHMEKMIHEKYAFISERVALQSIADKFCNMTLLSENFQAIQYAIALQKGSAYTTLFSSSFLRLHATGFFERWKQRHFPATRWCYARNSIAAPVNLLDMQGPFYITGMMLLLCVALLLGEIINKRWNKKCKRLFWLKGKNKNAVDTVNYKSNGDNIGLCPQTRVKQTAKVVREAVIHR